MIGKARQRVNLPLWAAERPRGRMTPAARTLCELARVEPDGRVLHVGCGDGEVLSCLAGAAQADLCGLDGSLDHVRAARERLPNADILYGVTDDIMWRENAFQTVLCSLPLWEKCDPRRLMAEAMRVLRPGGQIALSGACLPAPIRQAVNGFIDPDETGALPDVFHSRAEVIRLLTDAGFERVTWHAAGWAAGVAVGWKADEAAEPHRAS